MRVQDVREAYGRWAPIYDLVFGPLMRPSRIAAVASLPQTAQRVLEVGVGTGLSLPEYRRETRVFGIDLSPAMLGIARRKVAREGLSHVEALEEMDASAMAFPDDSFDAAMAMYVMTVVPDPAATMAEMRRVVRPGGRIIAVSHFAPAPGTRLSMGPLLAPLSRLLGWNTTVSVEMVASCPGLRLLADRPAGLHGYYRLLEFEVVKETGHHARPVPSSGG
jgi:phosphatidylethanolamine/phosphatidyl-N-methylethanolamine N-methyltransferase